MLKLGITDYQERIASLVSWQVVLDVPENAKRSKAVFPDGMIVPNKQ